MPSPGSAIANRIEPSPFATESRTGPPSGRVLDRVVDEVDEHLVQLAGVGDDARDPLRHVQVERDVLRQVRPRRLDHGRRELGGVALLDRDGELVGVEPAGDEEVVDDRAEPVRLGGDHAEQLLADLRIELDVGAADRLRRAVDRRQRRPQLVRDGGDEVGLHLLEPPSPRSGRGRRRRCPPRSPRPSRRSRARGRRTRPGRSRRGRARPAGSRPGSAARSLASGGRRPRSCGRASRPPRRR